jgi:magnesium transporter
VTTTRSRVYRNGAVVAEDVPLEDISVHLSDHGNVVWVDLVSPTLDDLRMLADELGLHELAVEDALEPHQRPKLDHYASHLFLSCHAVRMDDGNTELQTLEVDTFINDRWLITVHNDGFPMGEVVERWDRSPDLAVHGIGFLLYGLLDTVVDGYFDVVERFDDYYDEVSEGIFADHPIEPSKQKQWFGVRRDLVRFHRLVSPLREAVSALLRREHGVVPEPLYPYFQDIYDHILRIGESTESLRDLVSTIVETNLSLRDYRQNQIMKKVTSWAAIIAVPTLITGFYGMNVPYPGYAEWSGVAWASGLIVIMSGALYVLFKKADWL